MVCLFSCSLSINKVTVTHFDPSRVIARVSLKKDRVTYSIGSAVLVDVVKKTDHHELLFMTAKHVVKEPNGAYPTVQFFDYTSYYGKELPVVKIIHHPDGLDLSILVVHSTREYYPILFSKSPLIPLIEVMAIGYPADVGLVTSLGLLSNPESRHDNGVVRYWICTAATYFGGSGGAVVERESGNLIGIVLMIGYDEGPRGEAIPLPNLNYFLPIKFVVQWIKTVRKSRQLV